MGVGTRQLEKTAGCSCEPEKRDDTMDARAHVQRDKKNEKKETLPDVFVSEMEAIRKADVAGLCLAGEKEVSRLCAMHRAQRG